MLSLAAADAALKLSTGMWAVVSTGVGAGGALVFILSVGYYITPAIVGGTDGIFISNSIANYIKSNQGLRAALASILFGCVLILYFVYDKVIGLDKTKLH